MFISLKSNCLSAVSYRVILQIVEHCTELSGEHTKMYEHILIGASSIFYDYLVSSLLFIVLRLCTVKSLHL